MDHLHVAARQPLHAIRHFFDGRGPLEQQHPTPQERVVTRLEVWLTKAFYSARSATKGCMDHLHVAARQPLHAIRQMVTHASARSGTARLALFVVDQVPDWIIWGCLV